MGAHPPFGRLSRRGLNTIKPVYDPDRPDGRFNLTASAFNQLGLLPAVLVAWATATQNSPFSSLAVVVTIASTHCAYPRRDGQAELGSLLHKCKRVRTRMALSRAHTSIKVADPAKLLLLHKRPVKHTSGGV